MTEKGIDTIETLGVELEEVEARVKAFVTAEIRAGRCPQCLAAEMIGAAVDLGFDGGFVENVHEVLRRTARVLDECQDEGAQLH